MNLFAPAKKTVDGVMSAFNTAIADLEEVQARETEQAQSLDIEVELIREKAAAAREEAARAFSVMTKLRALVAA